MTNILTRRIEDIQKHTDTQGRKIMLEADGSRDWSDAAANQGTPDSWEPPEAKKRQGGILL